MTDPPQLSPERLARLLDQAVSRVTPAPGTLDLINRGIRRRRGLRRAGAALLSAAVLGAGVTVLAVLPGGTAAGPQALSSPSANAPASQVAGRTAAASLAPPGAKASPPALPGAMRLVALGPLSRQPDLLTVGVASASRAP